MYNMLMSGQFLWWMLKVVVGVLGAAVALVIIYLIAKIVFAAKYSTWEFYEKRRDQRKAQMEPNDEEQQTRRD